MGDVPEWPVSSDLRTQEARLKTKLITHYTRFGQHLAAAYISAAPF